MSVGVSCNIFGHIGKWTPHGHRLYSGRCYSHKKYWQMLCHEFVADIRATIIGYVLWVMEGHCDRCYSHMYWVKGKCYCQYDRWNNHMGWDVSNYGKYYCHCGRWIGHIGWIIISFILSFSLLNRTSSHMWGIWYLPMLLLRDGLLTLMLPVSWSSGPPIPLPWNVPM